MELLLFSAHPNQRRILSSLVGFGYLPISPQTTDVWELARAESGLREVLPYAFNL
jgi:hypothetical protein